TTLHNRHNVRRRSAGVKGPLTLTRGPVRIIPEGCTRHIPPLRYPCSEENAVTSPQVIPFDRLSGKDVALVGGKNASLGEMISTLGPMGVRVPPGFATSAEAYRSFLAQNGLEPIIASHLADYQSGKAALSEAGTA